MLVSVLEGIFLFLCIVVLWAIWFQIGLLLNRKRSEWLSFLPPDVDVDSAPLLKRLERRGSLHACHRGGAYHFGPENTIPGFRKCVLSPICTDILEFDLRLTKDDHLVLMHDKRVDRTTNGTGNVCDLTLNELKSLDAAYWFTQDKGKTYPLRDRGVTIPTFFEFLDEFAPVQENSAETIAFMCDVKDARAMERVLLLLEERDIASRTILVSMPSDVLSRAHALKPQYMPLCSGAVSCVVLPLLHWTGVFGVWQDLDESVHQEFCLRNGVNLIITDRPDVLRQTMDAYGDSAISATTALSTSSAPAVLWREHSD